MKRQKDVRTYLFPWVLLTATTFFFYAIEEYSGYLYVFEQFLTICKYFSYVYALILLTEFFRYRMEHPGKKSAKKHTKRAAFRRRKKDLAEPPAAAPAETAETTAPAEEQKARTTYDNILRFVDETDVADPIKFLREREIVHYQRFGEGLRLATDRLDSKNFYAFNPSFDKK